MLYNFSVGLKKARKTKKLTQQSFCDEYEKVTGSSITIETVRNWEQGRAVPRIESFRMYICRQ